MVKTFLSIFLALCSFTYAFSKAPAPASNPTQSSKSSSTGSKSSSGTYSTHSESSNSNSVSIAKPRPIVTQSNNHSSPSNEILVQFQPSDFHGVTQDDQNSTTAKNNAQDILTQVTHKTEQAFGAAHDAFAREQYAQLFGSNAVVPLQTKNLSAVQVKMLEVINKSNSWQSYVNNNLDLHDADQIAQLYTLYQFDGFRNYLGSLNGYDQAMINAYNRLDPKHKSFDPQVFNFLKYTTYATCFYEHLNSCPPVKTLLEAQGKAFTDQISQCTIEHKIEAIKAVELERNNKALELGQRHEKLKQFDRNYAQAVKNAKYFKKASDEIGALAFEASVRQLQMQLLDQKITQSQKLIKDWQHAMHVELSTKTSEQLQEKKTQLDANITATHQKLNQLRIDYQKALIENGRLQTQKGLFKTNYKQDKLDPLLQQKGAINARIDCLKKQYEQVDAHEYLVQNKNEHYQGRVDALHGKNVAETVTLTDKAQVYLNKLGVDVKTLLYKPANSFQIQSQQEVITLLNHIADNKEHYTNPKVDSLFDASAQLARAALNASKYNNMIKTWTLLDASQSLCDVAKYGAEKFAQAAEWVALHPGKTIEAGGKFAKGVLIAGPANTAHKVADIAEYVVSNPEKCAQAILKLAIAAGHAETVGVNNPLNPELLGIDVNQKQQTLREVKEIIENMSLNEIAQTSGEFIGEFVTDCIVIDGTLNVAGKLNTLVKHEIKSATRFMKDSARGAKVLTELEGLELAVNAIDAQIVKLETDLVYETAEALANVHIPIQVNSDVAAEIIAQESPLIEAANKSLQETVQAQLKNFAANPAIQEQISKYITELNCNKHPKGGRHIFIPKELKDIVFSKETWDRLAEKFDGMQISHEKWDKPVSTEFNYRHFLHPDIKVNCLTGEIKFGGFHHDHLGKIQESGVIKFTEIIEKPHGFYKAKWQWGSFKSKFSSFFPKHWTHDKIMSKVEEALKNTHLVEFNEEYRTWEFTGKISEGIDIIIVFATDKNLKPTGRVSSVYAELD